jgi:hypothetical protein
MAALPVHVKRSVQYEAPTLSTTDDTVWHAVRFESVMRSGRTRPLLLECEADVDGRARRARFVTKVKGLPEVQDFTLAHELLGCRLAAVFGLSAPAAHVVSISQAFVRVTQPELDSVGLNIVPGLGVGSEFVSDLMPFPLPARLHDEAEVQAAAALYAFDLLTQNPDRAIRNPNCGRAGQSLVPWDFESAFSFRFAILPEAGWRVAALPFAREHVLHGALRSASVDWPQVFTAFRDAPDEAWRDACSTIPEIWAGIGADVIAHLTSVFGHWPEFEREVVASLEMSS